MSRLAKLASVLVALVVLVLLLAGCGKDDLDGKVTSKTTHAGYYWMYLMPIGHTSCSGKPTTCTTYYTYVPILYWIPPCYEITVEGPTSGKTCLDRDEWNTIEVGDSYTGPDADPKDAKEERKRGSEQDGKS